MINRKQKKTIEKMIFWSVIHILKVDVNINITSINQLIYAAAIEGSTSLLAWNFSYRSIYTIIYTRTDTHTYTFAHGS